MRKIFTLHLSPELHKALAVLAKESQRSMSGQMRWLIKNAEPTTGIGQDISEYDDSFLVQQSNRNEEILSQD